MSINVCTCFLCIKQRTYAEKVVFLITVIIFIFALSLAHNAGKPKNLREIHHPVVIFADLKQDFRVQPKDVNPASGDTAIMECDPPKGHPEPSVAWHKNGQAMPVDNKKR